jgi:hypothetical protein
MATLAVIALGLSVAVMFLYLATDMKHKTHKDNNSFQA